MSKLFKIIGVGLLAILVIVIAAAAIFVLTFDANEQKDRLERIVAEQSGRQLSIEGDLDLSIFPWLGVDVGRATLANAQGFGDEPFAVIERATAGVRLLPLFRRQIEIGSVRIEGLELALATNASGQNNWDDLKTERDAETAGDEEDRASSFWIGSVEVVDAAVRYVDRQAKRVYAISDWDLNSGSVESGKPFSLETSFDFDLNEGRRTGRFVLNGTATADMEIKRYRIERAGLELNTGSETGELDLQLKADELMLEGKAFSIAAPESDWRVASAEQGATPLDIRLNAAAIRGDLDAETLTVDAMDLEALGVRLRGEANVAKMMEAPRMTAALTSEPFSMRDLLQSLGTEIETADSNVLSRARLASEIVVTEDRLNMKSLQLELDDSVIRGALRVSNFDKPALRFDLAVDQIDLDRYMPPVAEGGAGASEGTAGTDELPVETLRALDIDGTFKADQLIFSGIRSNNAQARLRAKEGRIRLHPSTAELYGGSYTGDLRLNVAGAQPRLSTNEHVSGIQFGALSADVFQAENKDTLTGIASADLKLTAVGRNADQMQRTLNGNVRFELKDGAYEGVDLWHQIRSGLAGIGVAPPPERASTGRTEFSDINGTAVVQNGIMKNDDLVAEMPFLRLSGAGEVNIPEATIDYLIDAEVVNTDELGAASEALTSAPIPIRISGNLVDPKVRPDIETYVKRKARSEIEEKKEEAKEELQEKLEEKLEDKLKDLIGG